MEVDSSNADTMTVVPHVEPDFSEDDAKISKLREPLKQLVNLHRGVSLERPSAEVKVLISEWSSQEQIAYWNTRARYWRARAAVSRTEVEYWRDRRAIREMSSSLSKLSMTSHSGIQKKGHKKPLCRFSRGRNEMEDMKRLEEVLSCCRVDEG